MKWIVLEENPLPDNYIVVMAAEDNRTLQIEKKQCSIFDSCEKAMDRARELRQQYKVPSIRLFHQDGISALV